MNEITTTEKKQLVELETIIECTKESFIECGLALAKIRDQKLYRSNFGTFEDYCKSKWGWGRQRAYNLIDAAISTSSLEENVQNFVQNPAQATALKKVPKKRIKRVLKKAQESGKLTAASIEEAAEQLEKESKEKAIELDKLGFPIPEEIQKEWDRADLEGRKMLHMASELKSTIKSFMDAEDKIMTEVTNAALIDAGNCYAYLRCVIPHSVCTSCHGKDARNKCVLCSGRGYISKFRYDQCVPEEVKAMRLKRLK
jgi:hypothetical protein